MVKVMKMMNDDGYEYNIDSVEIDDELDDGEDGEDDYLMNCWFHIDFDRLFHVNESPLLNIVGTISNEMLSENHDER